MNVSSSGSVFRKHCSRIAAAAVPSQRFLSRTRRTRHTTPTPYQTEREPSQASEGRKKRNGLAVLPTFRAKPCTPPNSRMLQPPTLSSCWTIGRCAILTEAMPPCTTLKAVRNEMRNSGMASPLHCLCRETRSSLKSSWSRRAKKRKGKKGEGEEVVQQQPKQQQPKPRWHHGGVLLREGEGEGGG